jgi:hypothetical protein
MRPDPAFEGLDRSFWAHVKLVSEKLGYSTRKKNGSGPDLRTYSIHEVKECLAGEGLRTDHVADALGKATAVGQKLVDYLKRRRELLIQIAEPNLMNREQAKVEFERLRAALNPKCVLPMNKQKGEKRHPSYLVGIVNMLTEQALGSREFCAEPRGLCIATKDGVPVRTFSRWMDGAYPAVVNPAAVWEVKEYYGTKTFGSRVADGVYETMLDGEELAEFAEHGQKRILHYLIVDDRFTWWECGRSYLCRIVDMLHSGLVDEVLFGREVLTRWIQIVKTWP